MKPQTVIAISSEWEHASVGAVLSKQEPAYTAANDFNQPSEYYGFGDGPF